MTDDYERHEALDRTFIIATMIDDFLRGQAFFEDPANEELSKILEECSDMLHSVYQQIGAKHL